MYTHIHPQDNPCPSPRFSKNIMNFWTSAKNKLSSSWLIRKKERKRVAVNTLALKGREKHCFSFHLPSFRRVRLSLIAAPYECLCVHDCFLMILPWPLVCQNAHVAHGSARAQCVFITAGHVWIHLMYRPTNQTEQLLSQKKKKKLWDKGVTGDTWGKRTRQSGLRC